VILPTKPYTPRHKGKVERGVAYVQDNTLKGGWSVWNSLRRVRYKDRERQEALAALLTFLRRNSDRMDYPRYERAGWPISNGPMESFCKQLGRRLKGPGMRWSIGTVNPMAALVSLWVNDQWDTYWHSAAWGPQSSRAPPAITGDALAETTAVEKRERGYASLSRQAVGIEDERLRRPEERSGERRDDAGRFEVRTVAPIRKRSADRAGLFAFFFILEGY